MWIEQNVISEDSLVMGTSTLISPLIIFLGSIKAIQSDVVGAGGWHVG